MAEVSYVQDFFVLRGNPDLCKKYQVDSALSAMVSRLPPPKETHSKERPAGSPSPGEAPQEIPVLHPFPSLVVPLPFTLLIRFLQGPPTVGPIVREMA